MYLSRIFLGLILVPSRYTRVLFADLRTAIKVPSADSPAKWHGNRGDYFENRGFEGSLICATGFVRAGYRVVFKMGSLKVD